MAIIDFALWLGRHRDRERALELERRVRAAEAGREDPVLAARRDLDAPDGIRLGHLAGPDAGLRVPVAVLSRGALIVGASGVGKTFFLVSLIDQLLRRAFGVDLPAGLTPLQLELELVDPKSETYQLVCLALAALYQQAAPEVRERIRDAVRVLTWSRDRVAPFCPYDNDGSVSDPFHAYLRSSVAGTAGPNPDTPAVLQLRFMLDRVLTALRFPRNYRLTCRFLTEPAFRSRLVSRVPDRDVRAFFEDLEARISRQTIAALLRRVQLELSFPEVKLALGIPPAALERVLPRRKPTIVLADFGPGESLPAGVCLERASHHVTDTLRWAPRRDPSVPKVLVVEEAPTLIRGATALTEPLSVAARTLRSAGVGVWYVAQDFVGGLPPDLVRTLTLNSYWQAVFRSGKAEAEWICGHLAEGEGGGDLERKGVVKLVEGMPERRLFFHQKGKVALPLATDDVAVLPAERKAELQELFDREIAPASTIPASTAAGLIEAFEAEVVDGDSVPSPADGPKGPAVGNLSDLLKVLGGEDDDVE
ncbi:MAG: hypothetical protein EDX89_05460 [Acidobacteria bacterium]|nr:MAG: hypothetical protein EDX89_05460 [Acidobacteriota bacterium]MCE7956462.1 hypothetical protein [Acidobacteria bacterium ACB2]